MLKRLQRAWRKISLTRSKIPFAMWHRNVALAPVLRRLDHQQSLRLRELTGLFLREKLITGAGGQSITEDMAVYVAAQACLLILNLDLDDYDGWSEVIIYPDAFVVSRPQTDSAGVIHDQDRTLAGEAWSRGPVILSWTDIAPGARPHGPASNVILHEFAHKLDMLNGPADGLPQLHRDMNRETWRHALSTAFEALSVGVRQGHPVPIDPYAATNPGEFFAVVTEYFFEAPTQLQEIWPDVFEQLKQYYRQDPGRVPH